MPIYNKEKQKGSTTIHLHESSQRFFEETILPALQSGEIHREDISDIGHILGLIEDQAPFVVAILE